MNASNRLPFKEKRRRDEWSFAQMERQERAALRREMKQMIKEKESAYCGMSDKEKQEYEVIKRLKEFEERG